jgi:LysM repeat protein
MKWKHWSILIVLVLLNYIIFATAFTKLAEQRHPGPRPTRTPYPTFESVEPTPVAWIVLPTSTLPPTKTPVTPMDTPVTVEIEPTVESTAENVTPLPEAPTEVATEPPATDMADAMTESLPSATPTGEPVVHTVKRGETLSEIAKQYDVKVNAIAEANDLEDPSHIITGQKLTIPEPGQVPPTKTPGAQPTKTPKPQSPTAQPTPKPATKTPTNTTVAPTKAPPTTTPIPATAEFQFTGEVVWDPLVAPNCAGPAVSKQSVIVDTGGNPVDGVVVEVDCYGNRVLSHPSGNPGEYDPGHYDFAFGQTVPQDWTCTARVVESNGQAVDSSEVITIQFDTNDCNPDGDGHQVVIVNWVKHW